MLLHSSYHLTRIWLRLFANKHIVVRLSAGVPLGSLLRRRSINILVLCVHFADAFAAVAQRFARGFIAD